ncbi:MAG: hypothetical protein ACREYB_07915 [Casimicrobiaceae bacterium]
MFDQIKQRIEHARGHRYRRAIASRQAACRSVDAKVPELVEARRLLHRPIHDFSEHFTAILNTFTPDWAQALLHGPRDTPAARVSTEADRRISWARIF